MKQLLGRTAALHVAFWQYDPWYRPGVVRVAAGGGCSARGLLGRGPGPGMVGQMGQADRLLVSEHARLRATSASCFLSSTKSPNRRSTISTAFSSIGPRSEALLLPTSRSLPAALASYYRGEWAKAADTLKSATPADPNVQFVPRSCCSLHSAYNGPGREAQTLLRTAASAGDRQAGVMLGHVLFVGWGGLPKDKRKAVS